MKAMQSLSAWNPLAFRDIILIERHFVP